METHGERTVNPSIRVYVNIIENRANSIIRTGYYLVLLTPETMKLLWNTESNN